MEDEKLVNALTSEHFTKFVQRVERLMKQEADDWKSACDWWQTLTKESQDELLKTGVDLATYWKVAIKRPFLGLTGLRSKDDVS